MSKSSSDLYALLLQLSEPIAESLTKASLPAANVSVKSLLEPLLPRNANPNADGPRLRAAIRDFTFTCALLSSSRSSAHELLKWIPEHLAAAADLAVAELSEAYCDYGEKSGEDLVAELMPEVMRLLKERIKDNWIDKTADGDEVSAASARAPVGFAVVAAYQFRLFLSHQLIAFFIIFYRFDEVLNEMVSHLERQPRNKERRVTWLCHVEPLFNGVVLMLLAHFRRIFPLFFKWMHAADDETVLLVLKQIESVIKLIMV